MTVENYVFDDQAPEQLWHGAAEGVPNDRPHAIGEIFAITQIVAPPVEEVIEKENVS